MLKIEKIKDEIRNFNTNVTADELLSLEEYKEPIKLTRFEYGYLKFAKKEGFNFIARDNDGCVFLYRNTPWKDELSWDYSGKFIIAFAELFKFVKWEDEESWEIDKILSNCEVMQDE